MEAETTDAAGPGQRLQVFLGEQTDAYLKEHPMSGREALIGALGLVAFVALRLAIDHAATQEQCEEMREFCVRAMQTLPLDHWMGTEGGRSSDGEANLEL